MGGRKGPGSLREKNCTAETHFFAQPGGSIDRPYNSY